MQKENELTSRQQVYRDNLSYFTRYVFRTVDPSSEYLHNWHIDAMSEYLEACKNKEIKRLIINVPPRMMKSISVNIAFPAFLLGHDPATKIISASFAHELAIDLSIKTRSVVKSNWYKELFPDVALRDDQDTQKKFTTTKEGYRLATTVGSSPMGQGANFFIVDDLHNTSDAMSDVKRAHGLDWFDQNAARRLNNPKEDVIVIVGQRLHESDISGHLLDRGGWEHLCIPLIAESKKTYSFGKFKKTVEENELLHPQRLDWPQVEEAKRDMGSYGFAGQMQQKPAPQGGGIVKLDWFKRYNTPPSTFVRTVQSWDTAHKANAGSDYSVCTTWGSTDKGHYLLDVFREKMEYPDLKRKVIAMSDKYEPDLLLIEDKASGQSLIQDFALDGSRSVLPVRPNKDKITRMSAASPMIEAGNVYIPERAPWLVDFESEMVSFPNASHDDIVDSVSQYINWARLKTQRAPRIRIL